MEALSRLWNDFNQLPASGQFFWLLAGGGCLCVLAIICLFFRRRHKSKPFDTGQRP